MLADVAFPAPPCKPEPGRWTQIGSCADFFVLACAFHFAFIHSIKYGWTAVLKDADLSDLFTSEELHNFVEGLVTREKLGARKGRVVDMASDPLFVAHLLMFWVRCAGQRFFSRWLLDVSQAVRPRPSETTPTNRRTFTLPPVCDLVKGQG